jgi:hypothetical protein
MNKKFKFNLGDKVFILGHSGISIVTGRGCMEYISGGTLNQYQLDGGQCVIQAMEQILLTPLEYKKLLEEGK